MENRFDFKERASGKIFHAQKVMQTDLTYAYAISWVTEDDLFKVELYTVREVEIRISVGQWEVVQ